jgi:hypothetical protein
MDTDLKIEKEESDSEETKVEVVSTNEPKRKKRKTTSIGGAGTTTFGHMVQVDDETIAAAVGPVQFRKDAPVYAQDTVNRWFELILSIF